MTRCVVSINNGKGIGKEATRQPNTWWGYSDMMQMEGVKNRGYRIFRASIV